MINIKNVAIKAISKSTNNHAVRGIILYVT
jgi:hypothetical protein